MPNAGAAFSQASVVERMVVRNVQQRYTAHARSRQPHAAAMRGAAVYRVALVVTRGDGAVLAEIAEGRSMTLRCLYAAGLNTGGRPPVLPRRIRPRAWSAGSGMVAPGNEAAAEYEYGATMLIARTGLLVTAPRATAWSGQALEPDVVMLLPGQGMTGEGFLAFGYSSVSYQRAMSILGGLAQVQVRFWREHNTGDTH